MLVRPYGRASAAILFAVFLAATPIVPALGKAAREADPPVFVTNLADNPVELQWQTVQPDTALSPIRGAMIAEDAMEARADEGLFWFYESANDDAVENVVFVSIVDADGAIVSQVVMDEEIAGTLGTVEATALHITIEADGTLTLSVHDAE